MRAITDGPQPSSPSVQNEPEHAPRDLNRLEVLKGLRLSIWEAGFATVHGALTAGAFLTGFALWLGADDLALGLLTAIPTFAGLIQIVASYFGRQTGGRRTFVARFALAGRIVWVPLLFLPIFLPRPLSLYAFLLLFALSFALLNVTVPAWTSWMSDLVPPDHRGRYFARRNTIAGIVGMLISLPAAWFLDFSTKKHHWEALGFGALFGIAAAGGVASFLTLLRQPEPVSSNAPPAQEINFRGLLEFYRAPFDDRNFRRLMLFNMVFSTGQFFAAPFFIVYALKDLHLGYVWLQMFATLSSLAGLGSMAFWGYLADKFGNKPVLAIGVIGVFLLPFPWIFASADRPQLALLLLTINNLAGGLFWAGVSLTQFNLLIRLSPSEKTGVYVATMAAVSGLTGGAAPLLGGALMRALENWHVPVLGISFGNFHAAFLIAAALRIFALIFLRPVADTQSTSTRSMLQQLTEANPRAWSHIRRLRGRGDEETRLRATASLATSRTRLAVPELISALTDPSLAVREEAARALGEIGETQAVEPLIAALNDPVMGLANEAAQALGRIGDRRATPALVRLLKSDSDLFSHEDRIAAIRAAGAVGGPDAAQALLEIFQEASGREEEQEILVRALGLIGDSRAVPVLAAKLQDVHTSRPLRLALVRALGELSSPLALTALHQELRGESADGVLFPMLADALARLQDTSAVPMLLDGLIVQESPVARKQAAHAIGMLLGEGEGVYGLLAQEEFSRDAGISRLFDEIQRALRPMDRSRGLPAALEAYMADDYWDCVRILAEISAAVHAVPAPAVRPAAAHCHAALQHAAAGSPITLPQELVILCLFALRGSVR